MDDFYRIWCFLREWIVCYQNPIISIDVKEKSFLIIFCHIGLYN